MRATRFIVYRVSLGSLTTTNAAAPLGTRMSAKISMVLRGHDASAPVKIVKPHPLGVTNVAFQGGPVPTLCPSLLEGSHCGVPIGHVLEPHALRGRHAKLRLAATAHEGCLDGAERVAAGGKSARGRVRRGCEPWVHLIPSDCRIMVTAAAAVAAAAHGGAQLPAGAAAARTPEPRRRLHVLVAEDYQLNLRLITRLLQMHDFEVTAVADGGAALTAMLDSFTQHESAQSPFDAIVLDMARCEFRARTPGADARSCACGLRYCVLRK